MGGTSLNSANDVASGNVNLLRLLPLDKHVPQGVAGQDNPGPASVIVSGMVGPYVQGCSDKSLIQRNICLFFTFSCPKELEPFRGSLKDSAFENNNN